MDTGKMYQILNLLQIRIAATMTSKNFFLMYHNDEDEKCIFNLICQRKSHSQFAAHMTLGGTNSKRTGHFLNAMFISLNVLSIK